MLKLSCCGREDGIERFKTWEEADAFRESYCTGPACDPHGYSGIESMTHKRAGIIEFQGAGDA